MSDVSESYVPRLKVLYETRLRDELASELGGRHRLDAPRLEKVVLNMCVGEATRDAKLIDSAAEDLSRIAGQKPIIVRAKKSEASFKLREGMRIGVKATLRRRRMYEFVDRLITIALPRQRDFRGLSPKSFDGRGNYALGIREQIVFPEIDYDKSGGVRGFDVVICTTAREDSEARLLLSKLNFPFQGSV